MLNIILNKVYPGYQISANIIVYFRPLAGIILGSKAIKNFYFIRIPPSIILLIPISISIPY